jgi:hypothetical protein
VVQFPGGRRAATCAEPKEPGRDVTWWDFDLGKGLLPTAAKRRRPQSGTGLAAGDPKGLALMPARTVSSCRVGGQVMLPPGYWEIGKLETLEAHRATRLSSAIV